MSAPLMIQADSVECSDGIKNKPALLQYALGEDRPSLKHKAYRLYGLKDLSTRRCILFPLLKCIILNARELLIFSQRQLQIDSLHIFTVDSMQLACHDSEEVRIE